MTSQPNSKLSRAKPKAVTDGLKQELAKFEEQDFLTKITHQLETAKNPNQVLNSALQVLNDIFGVKWMTVWRRETHRLKIVEAAGNVPKELLEQGSLGLAKDNGIAWQCVEESCNTTLGQNEAVGILETSALQAGGLSCWPLKNGDGVLWGILAMAINTEKIPAGMNAALGTSSLIISNALERTRLLRRYRNQNEELDLRNQQSALLASIAAKLAERGELPELIQASLQTVVSNLGLMAADALERRGDTLFGSAYVGQRNADLQAELQRSSEIGEIESQISSRKPRYTDNNSDNPKLGILGVQALAFVPVGGGTRRKSDWQGYVGLRFFAQSPGMWTAHARRILEGTARIISAAIDRERRAALIDNQARALNAFATFAEAAATETRVDVLAKRTLEIIRATLGQCDTAYYRQIKEAKSEKVFWQAEFWYGEQPDELTQTDENPASLVPGLIENTPLGENLPAWLTELSSGAKPLFVYPIVTGKKLHSFITVRLPEQQQFSERDSAVVRAVGRGLGVAIQRAEAASSAQEKQEQLEQERLFLRALLSSLSEGIVACDKDGMITQFNETAQDFYGLGGSGSGTPSMFSADGATQLKWEETPLVRALSGQGVENMEISLIGGTTNRRTLLASSNPIVTPDGSNLGAVMALHDISERKRAEARLRQLHLITAAPRQDFSEKMIRLLEMGCREFSLEIGALGRIENGIYEVVHSNSNTPITKRMPSTQTFCQTALELEEPLSILDASLSHPKHKAFKEQNVTAYIGLPVRVAGQDFGTLSFESLKPRTENFSNADLDLLRLMAQWIGGELERQRNEQALKQQNLYLSTLHETTLALMDRFEVDRLLLPIVSRTAKLIGAEHGYVYLKNEQNKLELKAGIGNFAARVGEQQDIGDDLISAVAKTGTPQRANQLPAASISDSVDDTGYQSLVAPLKSGNEVIGVLGLTDSERKLGEGEMELLSRFAAFASLALDNANLYAEAEQEIRERRRAEVALAEQQHQLERQYLRQSALAELELSVDEAEALGKLLTRIAEVAVRLLPSEFAAILLWNGTEFSFRTSANASNEHPFVDPAKPNKFVGEELAHYMIERRTPLFYAKPDDPSASLGEALSEDINTVAGFPLIVEGEVLGAIYVLERIWRKFAKEDRDFLAELANRAAIAINKVGLYERLRTSNLLLAERSQELESRNAEQETFVYTVSHDLRSPLLSIQGMATLLQEAVDNKDGEESKFLVSRIERNVSKMGDLLNDLLALSRVGRSNEENEVIELGEVVETVLVELEPRLRSRSIEVRLPESWPKVLYTRTDLYQLLANLMGNATKFAGKNGSAPILEVAWQKSNQDLFIELNISDNGAGIKAEYRERIFGLFQKLDANAEGTGVGLAIVKRIAERHGGKVWVKDTNLGGACFSVTIPLALVMPTE